MNNVSLVVMERGSDWPGHVASMEDVVAFSPDEGLVHRIEEKLHSLRSHSRSVRVAVLACSDTSSAASAEQRYRVARALLAAVARSRLGRLVLCAGAHASEGLRCELLNLAGALTSELGPSSATTVCLRFAQPGGGDS